MRYFIRLAVVFLSGLASLVAASAEKRVTLVIGNADYKIGRLANPVNDAEAVSEAFKTQLKFAGNVFRSARVGRWIPWLSANGNGRRVAGPA